jgi:hypothetical protein
MIKAQIPIPPAQLSDIPRTKDLINRLPPEMRICSRHGEAVAIMESDFSLNQGGGIPFAKASYVSCCNAAIEKLIDAIIKEVRGSAA